MAYKCLVHLVEEGTGEYIDYLGVVEFYHRPMRGDELASQTIYELLSTSLKNQHPWKSALLHVTKVRLTEGIGADGRKMDDSYLVIFGHLGQV